jgi:CHAT domain-containing protein/Tfp pilus assembly protein PilF
LPARSRVRALGAVVLGILSVLACGRPPAGDAGTDERIFLSSGASYSRTIAGPHRFHFKSTAGRFLHLIVEQRGIDVVVSLRDPAGRLIFEVDSPSGAKAPEVVLAVTPVAGEYTLILDPSRAGKKGDIDLRVRELRRASPEDRLLATATAAYARAERRLDDKDVKSAIRAYREALPGFASLGRREELARTQWRLGRALLRTGNLTETAEVLDRAVAGFRDLGNAEGEARALNDLGTAFRLLGEPDRALAAHRRALDLYRVAGDDAGQATSLNDLGLALESTGGFQDAIDRYEEALDIWRKLGARPAQAVTLQNLGSVYIVIGHDEEGMDLLQRALSLLPSGNQREERERIGILVAVGWAYYLVGRPEMALVHYREAITLAQRQEDRLAEAGIWDRQGSALRALHRYEEARISYSRALAMSRAAKSPKNQGHTLANLGWLDLEAGAVERGRSQLREAVDLLAASGDPNGETFARVGISRADRRLGAFDEAWREIETAVRRVEEMRTGLDGPMSRGQFLATRYDAFEEQVALLMDLHRREPTAGYDRQALEVAEKARARNLSEEIAGEGDEPSADGSRRRQLQDEIQKIDARRQSLAQADPRDPRLRGLDVRLREKGMEIDRLAASGASRRGLSSLDVARIQALAGEDTLLVVYLLSEPESFAWTIDHRHVEAHVLPGRERIEKLARRLVAALSQAQGVAAQGTAVSASRELSRAILAPLRERLSGRQRLVILADGALHLIPFAALPEPASGSEPLLVSHEIVMLPSATFLAEQRRRLVGRRPAPGAVAVIADPVFSSSDERLSAAGETGTERSSRKLDPGPLQRLAATAREAKAILRLAPPGETFLAEGPAASRGLVTSGVLSRYRIVHFATHGLLHPVLPERSGLVLSLYDDQGRRQDGFLPAPEVARLKLPAELVVLSACQTGLGREMRGEGLVGLTQAFFQAGARRVVVSYWNVQDLATAELMARFYKGLLGERLPPAAALRAAQLSIRAEDRWKSPYFWAGFVLHGDWR